MNEDQFNAILKLAALFLLTNLLGYGAAALYFVITGNLS